MSLYSQRCGMELAADWHGGFRAALAVYGHIPRTTHYAGVRFEAISPGYSRAWGRRRRSGTRPEHLGGGMIEALLPARAVAVEAFTDVPDEPPFPGEEDLVEKAVQGRRQEFVTARRCARSALAALGYPASGPIRPGPRREPLWPAGVVGSITHCAGYRAAAVARRDDVASIGIDAEPHDRLPQGVHRAVILEPERAHLRRLANEDPAVHWDQLLFSAKEAVYKAWYPLTGRWLDFQEAELSVDRHTGRFRARILIDGTRDDTGPPLTEMSGRFLIGGGFILTAVSVTE